MYIQYVIQIIDQLESCLVLFVQELHAQSCCMQNQPYRTDADIFMLDRAATDEISVATEGGSVYFDENGEMEFSDQAY
ncbi:MAG: hypothetical protein EZS28_036704 [Streblomastix strix]|uniref:Uncharacterized protein n=1 Tax=Streblomastix strix TaxID=222440 RepID=A0A5J4UC49_9EUKA|nr:MAG: hypothetical protein EZS28_036704 [Streblomastix strix]